MSILSEAGWQQSRTTPYRVFLGGTCNGSKWRDNFEPMLKSIGFEWFNPVVQNWTPDCRAEEIKQRQECDFVLYVITPEMSGAYSIAEVVDDSNKRPEKTLFCILQDDPKGDELASGEYESVYGCFGYHAQSSMNAISALIKSNGAEIFKSLEGVVKYLNFENEMNEANHNDPELDV